MHYAARFSGPSTHIVHISVFFLLADTGVAGPQGLKGEMGLKGEPGERGVAGEVGRFYYDYLQNIALVVIIKKKLKSQSGLQYKVSHSKYRERQYIVPSLQIKMSISCRPSWTQDVTKPLKYLSNSGKASHVDPGVILVHYHILAKLMRFLSPQLCFVFCAN